MLFVLALAGCGGSESEESLPARGLSDVELQWLRETSSWQREIELVVADVAQARERMLADGSAREEFRHALERVRACGEGPDDPPSARLGAGARRLAEACAAFSAAARADERALGEDFEALAAAQESWSDGEGAVLRANDAIQRHLVESARLPRQKGDSATSSIDPRLSEVASAAVGRAVEVACWSHGEWERLVDESNAFQGSAVTHEFAGYAAFSHNRVHMESVVCRPLVRLAYGDERRTGGRSFDQLSFAVTLLTHESEHLVGPGLSEAEVECYAMQRAATTARALGASPAYARRLVSRYWREIYPRVPASYSSPECRDGGALDLRPQTAVWP